VVWVPSPADPTTGQIPSGAVLSSLPSLRSFSASLSTPQAIAVDYLGFTCTGTDSSLAAKRPCSTSNGILARS